MPTEIAVAVVEHEGRFLIQQRPPGAALAGRWEFPGGKVEPGESPQAASVRECREETGLDVEVVGEYEPADVSYSHGAVRLYFFACRPTATPLPCPGPTPCWVARDQLQRYEFPSGNRRLLATLTGEGPQKP